MNDSFDDFEIPAFECMGPIGSIKKLRYLLKTAEARIGRVKRLGLRPHPGLLASREDLLREIDTRVSQGEPEQ